MQRVFVSYSQEDEDAARTLKRALAGHGFEAWLAGDEIQPGESFAARVRGGLDSADAVVLLIGTHPSTWARNEWSEALRMSWDEKRNVSLVPILLPNADPPVFLQDQAHVRLEQDPADWDRVAELLETSPAGTFRWRTSETARTGVERRLTELERVAAALPDDPEADT